MARHACESVTAVEVIEKLVVDNPKVRLGLLDVWMWIHDKTESIVIALGGTYYHFIDLSGCEPTYTHCGERVVKANSAQGLIDDCPIKERWAKLILEKQLEKAYSGMPVVFDAKLNDVRVFCGSREHSYAQFEFDATAVIEDGVLNQQALDEVMEKGLKNAKAHV